MKRTDDGSWVLKPEREWIYAEVEPLVSEELWDRCNELLVNSVNHIARPTKRTVHFFAGLAFCACGEKMHAPRNSPKYVCGKCRTKIPTEDLEGIFVEQLKSFLISNDQVDSFLNRAREGLAEKEALLETRKKEVDRVRQEVDRSYRLYLDKEISSEAFGRFFRPIEERQKQLEEETSKLQADVDLLKIDSFSRDQVMNDANYLQDAWPSLDQAEKRKIVECITNKIVIAKNEVEIDLCYLPSSKHMSKRDRSLHGRTRADADLKSIAPVVQEILHKNGKNLLLDTISNPKSAASVCKICARMSPFLLAPLARSRNSQISRFTQVNSVRFDRF
jgi:site-specific DNA recombinase